MKKFHRRSIGLTVTPPSAVIVHCHRSTAATVWSSAVTVALEPLAGSACEPWRR